MLCDHFLLCLGGKDAMACKHSIQRSTKGIGINGCVDRIAKQLLWRAYLAAAIGQEAALSILFAQFEHAQHAKVRDDQSGHMGRCRSFYENAARRQVAMEYRPLMGILKGSRDLIQVTAG